MRKVFLGSSAEARDSGAARQLRTDLQAALGSTFTVTPWWQTNWKNLETALGSLEGEVNEFDYAVFLGWPDDEIDYRDDKMWQTRDNVIFEFGLFLRNLGKDRTFLVMPNVSGGKFHILTDLGNSVMTQRYDCTIGPPHIFTATSMKAAADDISTGISDNVARRLAAVSNRDGARERMRTAIGAYRSDIENFVNNGRSDTRLLNCSASYIKDLISYKSASTSRTVADGCLDIAIYFELVDDLLNIEQLAEKQKKTTSNKISEVWVFSDKPLEFLGDGEGETQKQLPHLQDAIVANIKKGVRYRYYVSGAFDPGEIEKFLTSRGVPSKFLANISVMKLASGSFRTFYTVHIYNDGHRKDIYMSALMAKRNDLLIKVSPTHANRIFSRLDRISGHETDVGAIKVKSFVHEGD